MSPEQAVSHTETETEAPLDLNAETLQDLDVRDEGADVKGGYGTSVIMPSPQLPGGIRMTPSVILPGH